MFIYKISGWKWPQQNECKHVWQRPPGKNQRKWLPAQYHARQIPGPVTGQDVGPATDTVTVTLSHITSAVTCTDIGATRLLRTKPAPLFGTKEEGVPSVTKWTQQYDHWPNTTGIPYCTVSRCLILWIQPSTLYRIFKHFSPENQYGHTGVIINTCSSTIHDLPEIL